MLSENLLLQLSLSVCQISEQIGSYIQSSFGKVGIDNASEKEAKSLVSEVDKESEKQLVTLLRELLPEAGFITEEKTIHQSKKKLTWIVDPLDGTTNFLYGVPYFAISIALCEGAHIHLGVVRDIMHQKTYHAVSGHGCFCNEKPIKVSNRSKISQSLIATGFPYRYTQDTELQIKSLKKLIQKSNGIRRLGSAALDLAMVAEGIWDGYYEYTLNSWDTAAGILLVREAGGICSDRMGNKNNIAGTEIIASNPFIFQEFLAILQSDLHV